MTSEPKNKKNAATKTIHIEYYALLREERGLMSETIQTSAKTTLDLYRELKTKYNFKLPTSILRVAVNDEFASWQTVLKTKDRVVFIPPVAGG